MKKLRTFLIIILAVSAVLLSFNFFSNIGILPGLLSLIPGKGVTEEEAIIIIQEIKNISQLFTQSYYDEIFFDSGIIEGGLFKRDKRIALIAEGYVKAGFDLGALDKDDFFLKDGKVHLRLPPPEILSVISNPSDQEIFISRGDISQDEENIVNSIISEMLKENALKSGILERSAEQGGRVIVKLLDLFGFENAAVEIGVLQMQLQADNVLSGVIALNYRGIENLQSIRSEFTVKLEQVFGVQAGEYKVNRFSAFPDRLRVFWRDGEGKPVFEFSREGTQVIRDIKNQGEIINTSTAVQAGSEDIYNLLSERGKYIFHYLRSVKIGNESYDVLLALGRNRDWKKLYINRSNKLIEIIEQPGDYFNKNGILRTFYSGFKILQGVAVPMKSLSFLDGRKVYVISIINTRLDERPSKIKSL